ncbi:NAD(P)-binding domain-containing protein [Frateuria sp.]|uniref:NADPH-dependent F420 reductase n=1 Tax=Frateuria sp. TaxID=2211372 RepID=UPI00182C092C|nr:NAD(P)-binding domain-containing protein [Frateuria sp.]NUR22790.1 NAD(P)-binding domain-containing protein [Frateuria sp.]
MNILLIGAGNMGSAFARQFARAGHRVRIAATSLGKAQAVAAGIPGVTAVDAAGSASDADAVIVATPYERAVAALDNAGPLDGKVVVDVTNPLTADYMGLTIGHDTSAAEQIAKAFPAAEVVKAFNTLFAQVIADGPAFADGSTAPTFVASDSSRAKATATTLAQSIGFDVIDAGALRNARYLEPLAGLNIYLGYGAGQGTGIAPTWIRRG